MACHGCCYQWSLTGEDGCWSKCAELIRDGRGETGEEAKGRQREVGNRYEEEEGEEDVKWS